jgi:aldehyde:ferredoxin oxidoreductase
MRSRHDTIPDWVFTDKSEKPPYTKGTIHMDRDDIRLAVDMFYRELGWDSATGAPTEATYRRLGLGEVARELGKRKLLP